MKKTKLNALTAKTIHLFVNNKAILIAQVI